MSSDIAIKVENLSKCYQIYEQPRDRLKQFVMPRLQRGLGGQPKQYYREFWALKDVSFEVKKGETVGIIGRNGSGKSTLLQIICGTLNPTGGTVTTHGRIAALLELGSGFNPDFTGRENVYINGAVLGLSRDELDICFDQIIAFADIGDFIEQPVKTYSSGMQMRLAFAVSVSVEPDILVVDEALAVGDMAFQQKCLQRLADLKEKGTTILMVSHDIMLIRNYCSYAIYIDCGVMKCDGDAELIGEAFIQDMHVERQGVAGANDVLLWRAGDSRSKVAFGSTRGRITGVSLEGECGKAIFQQDEILTVEIYGQISADVLDPEFVFQLRDSRGYVLYGIPSTPELLKINHDVDRRMVIGRLIIRLALGGGSYAVTIGLNDRKGDSLYTLIDKVVGIAEFVVLQNSLKKSHGCIDLQGEWKAW